jgi:hypothetical protein
MRGARSEEIKRRMLRDGAGGELAVPPLPCHHCRAIIAMPPGKRERNLKVTEQNRGSREYEF